MLKSRNESAIINTTSLLSYVPSLLEATYSASKTALAFYTKSLREHLKIVNSEVKVFELLPPLVATDMTAERSDKKISSEDFDFLLEIIRLFPKFTFGLINPKKSHQFLQK